MKSQLLAITAAFGLALATAAPAQQTDQAAEPPAASDQAASGQPAQGGMMGMGGGHMKQHKGHRKGRDHGGAMGPGMMTMMFVLMDTDGDEALSLEEVLAVHERMFKRVDADDDGKVTMDEMQGFMRMMHGGAH